MLLENLTAELAKDFLATYRFKITVMLNLK